MAKEKKYKFLEMHAVEAYESILAFKAESMKTPAKDESYYIGRFEGLCTALAAISGRSEQEEQERIKDKAIGSYKDYFAIWNKLDKENKKMLKKKKHKNSHQEVLVGIDENGEPYVDFVYEFDVNGEQE